MDGDGADAGRFGNARDVRAFLLAIHQRRTPAQARPEHGATTASRISPPTSCSCSSARSRPSRWQTFLAGQPMLMSMIWRRYRRWRLAASAIIFGSAPAICTEIGLDFAVVIGTAQGLGAAVEQGIRRRPFPRRPVRPPIFCTAGGNGRSVTPAIGDEEVVAELETGKNSMGGVSLVGLRGSAGS